MFVIDQLGVSVATDVFEEHKELLEKLRSIPSRKRKRLANQMFKKAKKIKLGGKDGKRKLGSRKKEEGTLQVGGEDIDISEIVFEEELVKEKMEKEQNEDVKFDKEEEEEEEEEEQDEEAEECFRMHGACRLG